MRNWGPLKFSFLLALAVAPSFGLSQIVPTMVNAPDTPVRLVSINSKIEDFLSEVTTKNVSEKTVKSFQLGVIMSVPSGCGPEEAYGKEIVLRIDRVNLAPGVSVQTEKYGLKPGDVGAFQLMHHADQVHTQLAVIRADFEDGTNWAITRAGPVYDSGLMSRDAALQCAKGPEAALIRSRVSCIHPDASSPDAARGYICVAGVTQACTNNADGGSCLSTICNGGLCPDQTCSCPSCTQPINPPPSSTTSD